MPLTFKICGNPDAEFVGRVKTALLKACPAIQNEAGGTANHAARLLLVGRILAGPDGYAQRLATMVALNSTIFSGNATLAAATDTQIEDAVNGLLDMLSLQGV